MGTRGATLGLDDLLGAVGEGTAAPVPKRLQVQMDRKVAYEQQRRYEEMELQQLSPEEIRQRRQRQRELMLCSERAAKSKSKTYRRILRRHLRHWDSDHETGKSTRADEYGSDSDPEGSLEDIKSRAIEHLAAEAACAEIEALEPQVDDNGYVTAVRRRFAARAEDAAKTPDRMSFGDGLWKRASDDKVPTDADTGIEADSASTKRVRLEGPVSVGTDKGAGDAQNPWLDESVASGARPHVSGAGGMDKETARVDKLAARRRRPTAAKMLAVDAPAAAGSDDDDGGLDDDGIRVEHVGARQKEPNPGALVQRELVEQAFVEDNVVEAESAGEKCVAMELDAPKDEGLALLGWVTDIQPKKDKVMRKAPEGSGVDKAKRLDANLGPAIINQRQQYKATMQEPMAIDPPSMLVVDEEAHQPLVLCRVPLPMYYVEAGAELHDLPDDVLLLILEVSLGCHPEATAALKANLPLLAVCRDEPDDAEITMSPDLVVAAGYVQMYDSSISYQHPRVDPAKLVSLELTFWPVDHLWTPFSAGDDSEVIEFPNLKNLGVMYESTNVVDANRILKKLEIQADTKFVNAYSKRYPHLAAIEYKLCNDD
ncbi:hypothetical protein H4R18_004379 [Coemansia javaensis]|uniref:Uncharacterized protein n=1 Tax=Coemansia javaensis TaxID=2761396 RepID=A0A9W8LGZ6_9FUNG|nr:hypothetical protein H4R18_004379 [Coemansia javaensis]